VKMWEHPGLREDPVQPSTPFLPRALILPGNRSSSEQVITYGADEVDGARCSRDAAGGHTKGVARVIAGEAGGRRLAVPAGRDTRPTSDRAREGLFATVTSIVGSLAGARVLDLYAGSGAVGLEALSRGAGHVLLVESGARAARVIRENIEAIGLVGAEVITGRVERVLARGPGPGGGRYDIVFADPPYALPDLDVSAMLSLLGGGSADRAWLVPGALVIVERATRSGPVRWPEGYVPDRARRYGEATFWYGRRAGTVRHEPP
jgi:16S rRNA (guanine966-N2)-methyltransferase